MSGGTTGTPKGVARHARRLRADRPADAGVDRVGAASGDTTSSCCRCRCSTSTRNVGVQALAFVNGNPLALVPNPRDLDDLLATIRRVKPAFFNGVPTLYIALLNHPDVQRGKVDFKSIKICFSGAAALHGRHEAALRSAHRRPHRRRLLADRSDDGAVRQPGAGAEQARLGRHAAARRRTSASSTPTRARAMLPAGEVGEICVLGAAADGRVLEPARTKRPASCATTSTTDGAAPLAAHRRPRLPRRGRLRVHRRSQEGPDQDERLSRCGRARSRKCWRRIRRSPRSASPACRDAVKGEVVKAWVVLRAGPARDRSRSCARSAASGSRRTRCRRAIEFRDRAAEDDGRQGPAAGAQGRVAQGRAQSP